MNETSVPDSDVMLRFLLPAAGVRGVIVRLEHAWGEVLSSHSYPPQVISILGEAVSAASALSALVKVDGALILQAQTQGDLHTLVAHATSDRTIRGLARYQPGIGHGSLEKLCGDGKLVITIDSGKAERYQGVVLLEGETLGAVLEQYFSQSEQLRTRLWLHADAHYASALLLQELADSEVEVGDEDGWTRAITLADTLHEGELAGTPPAELVYRLFHEEAPQYFPAESICFSCGCSVKRIETVLRSLGHEEVDDILAEKGQIDVDCEFCNRHYAFTAAQARALFATASPSDDPGPDDTVH